MNENGWPDELSALDAELMGLHGTAPPPALRERVLTVIERERSSTTSRLSPWAFAATAAAAALLWFNLSLSVVHDEGRNWSRPGMSPEVLVTTEEEIRSLAPELGPHAAGYAITLWSGSRLPRTANDWRGESHWKEFK